MFLFRKNYDADSPHADPERLKELLDSDEDFHLIDVRTDREYESGHLPRARLIPHTEILNNLPTPNKDDLIIVYCRGGVRSADAKRWLEASGYQNVVNFGGINRWNGPVEYGTESSDG
jgi:rhodanese-related sulfurtransferase